MQFRRSGQRDDRRRRVLIDENVESGENSKKRTRKSAADNKALSSAQSYSDDARSERQLRIIDAMPKRLWLLAVLLLLGVLCIGSLVGLHVQLPRWSATIHPSDLAALDLSAPTGLAAWFSSSLLLLAAAASLQVYALRRHKADDYRGRYRVWLWAAAVLAFASIDASTQIHLVVRGVMVHLAGQTLYGDGTIWWIIVYSVVTGALTVRMMIEMRHSRIAVAALLMAIVGYGGGIALELDLVTISERSSAVMAQSSFVMFGHLILLFSIWLYARRVYLDAHGQLPSSSLKKKTGRKQNSRADESSETAASFADEATLALNQRINREELAELEDELLQQESRPRKHRKSKREQSATPDVLQMDDKCLDADEDEPRRIGKAERRAIKKQRRQRRAA